MTDNPSSDIETTLGASTSNTCASAMMTCSVNNETSTNTTSEEKTTHVIQTTITNVTTGMKGTIHKSYQYHGHKYDHHLLGQDL